MLRPIRNEDVPAIVETMAAAFQEEALYVYFLPDADRRKHFLRAFMAFRLKFGMKRGVVSVTDDCSGVAIWLRPGTVMKPADLIFCGGLGALLRDCDAGERKRVMTFNDLTDRIQKRVAQPPFWHLSPVCVLPRAQGAGTGGKLLRAGLEMVSKSGLPCYLETQSAGNQALYEHFGFVCEDDSVIPGSALHSYAMLLKKVSA